MSACALQASQPPSVNNSVHGAETTSIPEDRPSMTGMPQHNGMKKSGSVNGMA